MSSELIRPQNVHRTRGYSHAMKVGNTIYVAGQVALDEQGNLVGKGDIVAQTAQAYENLRRVLAAAGATMDDIVSVNLYCTNLDDLEKTGEVFLKYFGKHRPPSTAVEISKLAISGCLIEVQAVAAVG